MGTLYVDRKGTYIKLEGGTLAFFENGKKTGTVPLRPLKRVIITTHVIIESPVLRALAESGVSVIFLSGKSMKFYGMLTGRLHKNGLLRLRQYEKHLSGFSLVISKEIVQRKVFSQRGLLEWLEERKPEKRFFLEEARMRLSRILDSVKEAETIDSLRGLEGSATSFYFSAYSKVFPESLNFHGRTRRPPLDPVNALLSFLYMRLHYEIVRETEIIGLDPTIGFFHQFEYGRESLACDLVELFRADVDKFVFNVFNERILTQSDFARDNERLGFYLKRSGRKKLFEIYENWIRDLRPALRQEVRNLARKVIDGEDSLLE